MAPQRSATERRNVTTDAFPASQGSRAANPHHMLSDSEIPTPVNPAELDSLPISDEQKARIIDRHLALTEAQSIQLHSEEQIDSLRSPSQDRSRDSGSRPVSHAESISSFHDDEDNESIEEAYTGPHQMQGGAITDDVYRWAHQNRRKHPRRARTESVHLPRTSTIDPDLDTSAIREPGGFR